MTLRPLLVPIATTQRLVNIHILRRLIEYLLAIYIVLRRILAALNVSIVYRLSGNIRIRPLRLRRPEVHERRLHAAFQVLIVILIHRGYRLVIHRVVLKWILIVQQQIPIEPDLLVELRIDLR